MRRSDAVTIGSGPSSSIDRLSGGASREWSAAAISARKGSAAPIVSSSARVPASIMISKPSNCRRRLRLSWR